MKRLLLLLPLLLCACTTTETVVDRVEVPTPYWRPPTNIAKLPERQPLATQDLTPEQAKADPKEAFQRLAEDISGLLAENEQIRHLYDELVKMITEEPKPNEEEQ